MTTTAYREMLHRLIDVLRPEDVGTAQRVPEALNASADPLLATLRNAPSDDEGETDAERAAVARARRDVEDRKILTRDEVRRRLRRA